MDYSDLVDFIRDKSGANSYGESVLVDQIASAIKLIDESDNIDDGDRYTSMALRAIQALAMYQSLIGDRKEE